MMATRQDIVNAARSYLGVRWRHQGRSREGVDCIGLVIRVAHDLGLSAYDTVAYSRIPDGHYLQDELEHNMQRVLGPAAIGDVLLMRFAREPQHVGIVSSIGIIHSYGAIRKVVEHRIDKIWSDRIVAAYSFKGID